MKPFLMMPIYLRSEDQYYNKYEEAKSKLETRYPDGFLGRPVDDWFYWPPWICNDIIGFLQLWIDDEGVFRYQEYSISYKKIPSTPAWRRRHAMWDIDHRECFDEDYIEYKDDYLTMTLPTSSIRNGLNEFLHAFYEELTKEKKYMELEHWEGVVACFDFKKFVRMTMNKSTAGKMMERL